MKEVGLEEFASLPEGTVFSFLYPGRAPDEGGLHRRGEVWRYGGGGPPDFWYADLLPDYRGPALSSGYELSDAECRWGMHDPSQRFLVYEPADLALLARMLGLVAPENHPEFRDQRGIVARGVGLFQPGGADMAETTLSLPLEDFLERAAELFEEDPGARVEIIDRHPSQYGEKAWGWCGWTAWKTSHSGVDDLPDFLCRLMPGAAVEKADDPVVHCYHYPTRAEAAAALSAACAEYGRARASAGRRGGAG